jgi:hypothetical protein
LFVSADGEDEPYYPNSVALAYCNVCPVKVECLDYALANHEVGTWGGTTAYQRVQLGRERDRAKCPSCGASDLIYENKVQLCLACGMSWPII